MTVVAITASRTSPGATALATGLAIAWSHRVERSLLIEADPAGGVLALRFDLGAAPSLTSFGSDVRNAYSQELVWANTQDLRGVHCMPAPVDPRLARSWIERLTPTLVAEVPRLGAPTVIDLGWVDEDGVSAPLAAAADTTLVVTSPEIAEVQSLLFQVRRLEAQGANVALVTVGNTPNDPQEIAAIAGVPLAAVLPDDARVAAALAGGKFTPKKFRRSLLWRTMCGLADALLDEAAMHARASETPAFYGTDSLAVDDSLPMVETSVLAGAPPMPTPPAPATVADIVPATAHEQPPMPTPPAPATVADIVPATAVPIPEQSTSSTPPVPTIEVAMRRRSASPSSEEERAFWAREGLNEEAIPLVVDNEPAWAPGPLQDLAPGELDHPAPQFAPVPAEPVAGRDLPAIVISCPKRSNPAVAGHRVTDPSVVEPSEPSVVDATLRSDFAPEAPLVAEPVFLLFDDGTCQELSYTAPITVGRHRSCDVVLADSQVSRQHARITYTTSGWQFVDLGSRNGSTVNGNACRDVFLTPGDELAIGRARLTFAHTSTREMECA